MTLSHKISIKMHFGQFEMCIILKTRATVDYSGISMKTVVEELLQLWPFETARHYGSHFEKNGPDRFCLFAYFVQSQPNFQNFFMVLNLSLIHISEPTRRA